MHRIPAMPLHRAGLSCCALILWRCATAGEASGDGVLAGPWVEIGPGGARLGVVLAQAPNPDRPWIRRGADGGMAVVPSVQPAPRVGAAQAVIASVPLPLGSTATTWRVDPVDADARSPWEVSVPARPGPGTVQRILLAGRWTWPAVADVEQAGRALEGPVDAVMPLGADWRSRLGDGGWESRVPVLDPGPGGSWGELGLAVEGEDGQADAARALVTAVATWRILLPRQAPWDPGIGAGVVDRGPGSLDERVHIATRLGCALILAPARGAGLISEPLATTGGGRLRAQAGGPRYALLPPGGEGLVRIDPRIALPLDEPAQAGLVVGPGALRVVIFGETSATARLEWGHAGEALSGPGTGAGEHEALAAAALAETPDAVALERLMWLPADEFVAAIERDVSGRRLATVRERLADGPLMRRLAVLPSVWSWVGEDERLLRDAILRRWNQDLVDEERWHDRVVRSADPRLVRALVAQADGQRTLLGLLVERLRLQADGVLPLESEVLLQHRALAAVFDSPYLSPTPLRPIAVGLSPRLPAAARGPLERFLERHGAIRR